MKKKMPYVLAGMLLMISLVCMACGSTQEEKQMRQVCDKIQLRW